MDKVSKFQKKRKSVDLIKKKASAYSDSGDDMFAGDHARFSPNQGKNKVRLLPANEDYWGVELFTHWISVDGKNRPYACPKKMRRQDCPICEERDQAFKDEDEEYAKELRPSQRLLAWIVDRDDEKESPKLWDIPRTIELDINGGAIDEDTGEVLPIDDPVDGFDITFNKEGQGIGTKYSAVNISRRNTPLSDDEDQMVEWLNYMDDNPLETIVNVYDYDHIKSVFEGKPVKASSSSAKTEEPEDDEPEDEGDDDQKPWDEDDSDMVASDESKDEEKEPDASPASSIRDRLNKRRNKG